MDTCSLKIWYYLNWMKISTEVATNFAYRILLLPEWSEWWSYDAMILNDLQPRYPLVPRAKVYSMYSSQRSVRPRRSSLQYDYLTLLGWYYDHLYILKEIWRRYWQFNYRIICHKNANFFKLQGISHITNII